MRVFKTGRINLVNQLKLKQYCNLIKRIFCSIRKSSIYSVEKYNNYLNYKLININGNNHNSVYTSLIITKRCNLNCSFCIVKDIIDGMSRDYDLSTAQAKKIFSHPIIRKTLMVMLTGGEPLLNDDIMKIIKIAKEYGHMVGITTNGVLLSEYIDDLIVAGIDTISVSLYDDNRRKLEDNLGRVTEKYPIRINKVITRSDIDDPASIESVCSFAIEKRCYGVLFQNLMPTNIRDIDNVIYDDYQQYYDVKRKINEKYERQLMIGWPGAVARTIRGSRDKKCRMPWWLNIVDAQGNLGLCCRYQNGAYGNIFNEKPGTLKNDQVWRDIREGLLSDCSNIPSECVNCYMLNDPYSSNI